MKFLTVFKKQTTPTEYFIKLHSYDHEVLLEPPTKEIKDQLTLTQIGIDDLKIAKALKPLMESNMDEMINEFYEKLLSVPSLEGIITKHSSTDRLKNTLKQHLIEMFSGKMDKEFFEKREAVAKIHFRIGLTPKWYMGSFQSLYASMFQLISEKMKSFEERKRAVEVVTKLLNIEQQLVLEAYEKENVQQREKEHEEVKNNLKNIILNVTGELAALSVETSASVEQLISNSNEVSNSVIQSTEKTKQTKIVATDSRDRMENLTKKMDELNLSSRKMDDLTRKLTDSSEEINRVIGIVKNIADQTTLLSLNSAIEAARAGEHGRGFAVVANEVKKLSEETKASVENIEKLVSKSSTYISMVNDAIGEVTQLVASGTEETLQTKETFEGIAGTLEDSLQMVNLVEEEFSDLKLIIKEIGQASSRVAVSAEHLNETARDL
ncbi:globin-coupled sensor protein [Evansella tamaricis]|uniref:Globin-coupled sensor protein n=1 Tax=Evansella tamaricis TaxID=2069301 RepID=A0ABS6JFQ0_9BACI|nr:globin-coupled sensor protein [Evansella tamaricis]MBU9711290.1 globin-coupled sensor protein [Evansella tamaricis]